MILILAALLAANLILAQSVQTVEALPANMTWYPSSGSTLQSSKSDSGIQVRLSNNPRAWVTTDQYVIGESDAVSGWIFYLVCTSATQRAAYDLAVNVYYSRDSTLGNLLQSGQTDLSHLNCDGTSENLIPLTPAHWVGEQAEYHLNLELHTSSSIAHLLLQIGGPYSSSISDGNSVPEYVLPLIALAPLIPIAVKRSRKQ